MWSCGYGVVYFLHWHKKIITFSVFWYVVVLSCRHVVMFCWCLFFILIWFDLICWFNLAVYWRRAAFIDWIFFKFLNFNCFLIFKVLFECVFRVCFVFQVFVHSILAFCSSCDDCQEKHVCNKIVHGKGNQAQNITMANLTVTCFK